MAEFTHKTNRGSLFKNDKKESENHPDYRGSIDVGGTVHWISAWLQETTAGQKYFSLSVQPQEKKEESNDDDNAMPF